MFMYKADLDGWAHTLGATNDGEALTVLNSLMARIDVAADELSNVSGALTGAPHDDARAALSDAYWKTIAGANDLADVVGAFKRHARGW
jgi:hypothetical protein